MIVGRYADVDGNVDEEDGGYVKVRGRVAGNVEEEDGGNVYIYRSARIDGDITEKGAGRIIRY